ncbi:MAG: c-type cytochrome [Ignavibacteria bacterium]|nr:c-type cytochrome [Ignavibacteria bacterium]
MKKFLKISGIIFAIILLLFFVGYTYIMTQYPKVPPAPDIKITSTPEMIERGKYLATGFAACIDCHSKRDFSKYAGPLITGTEGMGGEDFGEGAGYIPAKNITSDKETGLGNWTDGEIFRAITMGVDKNGEPLGPMMPYMYYRNMDENDVKSIIAYIRTLPPVNNKIEDHKLNFPVNLIFRTLPSEPQFKNLPSADNKIALGEYYAGACIACHSPMEKGEFIKDKFLGGGVEYPGPKGGKIRSANISPDKQTGIGNWTKEQFIKKFKSYTIPEGQNIPVKDGEFNTVMPWTFLGQASEDDLGAIYDYIMTQKPVSNNVVKFTP